MRKALPLLLFVVFKISFVVSQVDLEKDLIVYYPFDGNTIDYSGNGYHTISFATLAEDRFGKENSSYHFNGIDEYIDLPNIVALKPQLPITISFWVYFDDLEVTKTFMFTTDFEQDINSGVNMSLTSPKSSFAVAFGDGRAPSLESRRTKVANSVVKVNTWYFVVVTVVGALDMDIYLSEFESGLVCVNDGGEYSGNGLDMAYTDKPGSIGRKDAHSSKDPYYFKGKMDEFKMWSRKLSDDEIENLCSSNLSLANNVPIENKKNIYYRNSSQEIILSNLTGKLEIYNSIGIKVRSMNNVEDKLNISGLKNGIYILNFFSQEGESKTLKFIKYE